ncbi:hypothetical protein HDU93_002390 [Gonapodya sp. JEL0774]|nr:hypothetical protein HDU93_002390 [Gonapodya sp. JEL0774]
MDTKPAWFKAINEGITRRDNTFQTPFVSIFAAHALLAQRNAELARSLDVTSSNLSDIRAQYANISKEFETARELGSPENQRRVLDLDKEVRELKEERSELYMTQGRNAQRILELTDLTRSQEVLIREKVEEIEKLVKNLSILTRTVQDKEHLLAEKDNVIQILRDEHQTLHLEVVTKEEMLVKLESENNELVSRLLELKMQLANSMNEANQFVENALKAKEATLSRQPSLKTSSPISGSQGQLTREQKEDVRSVVHPSSYLVSTPPTSLTRRYVSSHTDTITALLPSPSGSMFATSSEDKSVQLWDAKTGQSRGTLGGSTRTAFTFSSCNDLALLDDQGSMVASGHLDNNVRIWDMVSGNVIREISGMHSDQITGVQVTPGRTHILTTSRDNTLRLIDLRTFQLVHSFSHDKFRVPRNWSKSCLSPDGRYIVGGSGDGSVVCWRAWDAGVEVVLKAHSSAVAAVAWSPLGGPFMFSADLDKNIVIWGGQS